MSSQRAEGVVVRGGRGILTLCQGIRDTALLVHGDPAALLWSEPSDPEHAWLVRAYDLAEIEETLALLDVDDEAPLAEALRPVLELLDDGAYDIVHTSAPELDAHLSEADARPHGSGQFIDWAGLHRLHVQDVMLIGGMPRDLLDRGRIHDLVGRIRAGERPAVVALVSDDVAFVIAGHAVLEAYRSLDRTPNLVIIEPLNPRDLSADEGADLLVRAYERVGDVTAAHYRAVRHAEAAEVEDALG